MVVQSTRRYLHQKGRLILVGIGTLALVVILQLIGVGPLDRAAQLLFDSYQRAAPRPYEDAPVRVVDIDEESLRRLGQWPWPRTDVADLTRRLADAGAQTIAFDIVFSEPDRTSPARLAERVARDPGQRDILAALKKLPDNDAALAAVFRASPTVLAHFLNYDGKGATVQPKAGIAVSGSTPNAGVPNFSNAIQSLPLLRDAAPGGGFVSLPPSSDGIVREVPLLLSQNGQLLPSLSLDALRMAQGAGAILVKSNDGSGVSGGNGGDVVSVRTGDFEVPTTRTGALRMYYTAPQKSRIVPAWKILTGRLTAAEMAKEFGGRIVFVGTGAQGLRDLTSTPSQDRELGVVVHAQAVEQMILKRFLTRPDWGVGLERVLLIALGLMLALLLPWLGATRGALLGLVMVGGTMLGSWEAFRQVHYLLDPTYPVLGILAVYGVETALTYYREERQRAYIHQAFDRYLSPELVKRIVDDPSRLELGGEEREMTVLFCDIRSFSRISEKLAPNQIIRFLIAFLTPMCDILLDRKATIDKFIGDAILAFWNAPLDDPDQYRNAARGALAMVDRLRELNIAMPKQEAEPWPGEVNIGIGLNAGPCCVGNMGSAQRLSYSLIGDTVNLASRIEGLTKYYGVRIAIGSALEKHLPDFAVVPLDRVRVVGRDAIETIFALLGDEARALDAEYRKFAESHAHMFEAYQTQAWDRASAVLDEVAAAAEGYGLGKYCGLIRDRIAHFRAHPPGGDWDGVFAATEK